LPTSPRPLMLPARRFMKVSPYKRLEKAVKRAYLKPLTLLRYGTLRPERAKLHGSDHWIYIDATDPCARKKVVEEPLRGKVSDNLIFWRDFAAHLHPDLIVDVGLNYGECMFGTDYETNATLFGFEANPRLIPHLEKSRAGHPAGERMTITNCLVSDAPAEDIPFYVNPDWSGSSSAVREMNDRPQSIEFKLSAKSIDSVVPLELARGKTLLFKMDIEGYESKALRGFVETLASVNRSVGFIEFDAQYITWAGQSPMEYLGWLQQRFHTYRVANIKAKTLKKVEGFADLPKLHGDPNRVHVDLVLVGKQSPESWLAPQWTIVESSPSAA
jgi:FkbM family methyltransferase